MVFLFFRIRFQNGAKAGSYQVLFPPMVFLVFGIRFQNGAKARGRLGAAVLPFLKQHAPAEEPLRSAVLARALRDIAVITQHGFAALLLAAEPRPAAV